MMRLHQSGPTGHILVSCHALQTHSPESTMSQIEELEKVDDMVTLVRNKCDD